MTDDTTRQDSTGATFECEDCGNSVEDASMRIGSCVECGGDMTLVGDATDEERERLASPRIPARAQLSGSVDFVLTGPRITCQQAGSRPERHTHVIQ